MKPPACHSNIRRTAGDSCRARPALPPRAGLPAPAVRKAHPKIRGGSRHRIKRPGVSTWSAGRWANSPTTRSFAGTPRSSVPQKMAAYRHEPAQEPAQRPALRILKWGSRMEQGAQIERFPGFLHCRPLTGRGVDNEQGSTKARVGPSLSVSVFRVFAVSSFRNSRPTTRGVNAAAKQIFRLHPSLFAF
jgi:hypothetical protein